MQSDKLTRNREGIHVAVIMDGNGRWAESRGLPRAAGHRAGIRAARKIVEHAADMGVDRLTLYAFSADNWRRPTAEVKAIFALLCGFLRLETSSMVRQGVRLTAIGRRDRLPLSVRRAIEATEGATGAGKRLALQVAIDYSGRDSIAASAARTLSSMRAETVSKECLAHALRECIATESNDVDLLIRTGGEKRLSDFLVWESAYAELHFTYRMWPDFDLADLELALSDFRGRRRRYGGLEALPSSECRPAWL